MARVIAVDEKALEQGDYTPIPDNTKLRVVIYDIEEAKVKSGDNAGKDQAKYTVKVVEDGPYKGREIQYNYVPLYSGKNAWVLTSFAEAVGWKVDKDSKTVEVPDNLKDVLGTEVIASFREEVSEKINPNTNKPYINNRVKAVRKIRGEGGGGGGGGTPAAKKSWGDL